MADRQGGGSYTPNRKPRRGRGGGNTPRGSQRGRGQQSGNGGDLQSPSVSTSDTPVSDSATRQEYTPTQSRPESQGSTSKSTPISSFQLSEGIKSSTTTPSPAAPPPAKDPEPTKDKKSMESSLEKTVTSTSSAETFSTPTSVYGAGEGQDSRTESYEVRKEPETKSESVVASETPSYSTPVAKTKEDLEKPEDEEKDVEKQASRKSSNGAPEKPPRKTSIDGKDKPKLFEAPPVEKSPRAGGEPRQTIDIEPEVTPQPSSPSASTTDGGGEGGEGQTTHGPISVDVDHPRDRKLSVAHSPGFAYGLGSPVGKPAYGISPRGDEGDDPWPPARIARKTSVNDIRTAAKSFSRRQWTTLIIFGLADLFSAIVISLQAPFYPMEAERKGATATEYGFVFGVYELVVFLTSPMYGKYMNKLGPRRMFNMGITVSSIACILFGLLDKIDDHTLFISLSFLLRITEAIGASAFVTSSFTIIACEFPESVATTFASLETFFGLGLIVGPTLGGALYQVGGYSLPFAVTGVCLLILAILAAFVMPKIETVEDEHGNATEGYGIFSILKIPGVILAAFSITMSATTLGFLSATLEPHLRQFMLTPLQTGLMFIINGGVYALFAPVLGWICDRIKKPVYVTFVGAIFIFVGFLLIGPAPFIPMNTILWVTGVGLFIHGIGLGATLVAGFISALRDSMDYGFPDNLSTYGVVSGLWTSFLSLGAFVGPSVGGALLDNFGFRDATWFTLISQVIVIILILIYLISPKPKKSRHSETSPLLKNKNDAEAPSASTSYGATTSESLA